jgi:hypothetical protein
MARVLALLRLREAAGQTTTLRHQKAHGMDAHFGPRCGQSCALAMGTITLACMSSIGSS